LFILHEDQKIHLAINRLGLSTLSPFNPKWEEHRNNFDLATISVTF
jgi:hypothetical protein